MNSPLLARLTDVNRDTRNPNLRPRDAATLIVVDRSGRRPKVLMGKRHPGLKFMPGKFVFPGGRIEPEDRRMAAFGALDSLVERRLTERVQRPSLQRARALALAAIRETFEETGVLLGTREHGAPDASPGGAWAEFAAHGVFPALENLHFIARAITPPRRPRRFDTRFFSVDASGVAGTVEGVTGPDSELVEVVWVDLKEAIALDLPPITAVVLEELGARLAAGMDRRMPVPFYYQRNGTFRREEIG